MDLPLPFFGPDPHELAAPPGEAFRRQVRAHALLEMAEFVDSERRAEIAREILILGPGTLPALFQAANSRQENRAALARSLVRLLVPDEVGRQIHQGLQRDKQAFVVERGAVLLSRLSYPNLPVDQVLSDIDALGQKAGSWICTRLGLERDEVRRAASAKTVEVIKSLSEFWREEGFHGNTGDYYSDRNSYLPDVLERRTGLPIALSVLFLALARRVHLKAEAWGCRAISSCVCAWWTRPENNSCSWTLSMARGR